MTKTLDYPALSPTHIGVSQLRDFHLSEDAKLVAALATIDGYVDVRRKLLTLADYQPELLPPPPDPLVQMCAVIAKSLDEGTTIPPRLAEEIPADPDQVQRHNQLAGVAKRQVASGLIAQLDEALLRNVDVVYTWLNRTVADVVERARQIQARGDRPANATEAIANDRVEDYRAVQGLEQRYAQVRRLQAALVPLISEWAIVGLDGRPGALRLYLKNPVEVLGRDEILSLDVGGKNTREGWDFTGGVPDNWHAGEAVWWFGTNTTAEPWVPTAKQYAENRAAIMDELNPSDPAARAKQRDRQNQANARLAQHQNTAAASG